MPTPDLHRRHIRLTAQSSTGYDLSSDQVLRQQVKKGQALIRRAHKIVRVDIEACRNYYQDAYIILSQAGQSGSAKAARLANLLYTKGMVASSPSGPFSASGTFKVKVNGKSK